MACPASLVACCSLADAAVASCCSCCCGMRIGEGDLFLVGKRRATLVLASVLLSQSIRVLWKTWTWGKHEDMRFLGQRVALEAGALVD